MGEGIPSFFLVYACRCCCIVCHFEVCALFVISTFCDVFFNVTNVVFTCPLSCSENLEVIVSVCDSLVRRCGRVVTIIIVIVYNSLVRHCGKVLANVIVIV